jgi:arsenite methyltransferase
MTKPVLQGDSVEFKACCADFYADDLVRKILGDSFHPGKETLTRDLLKTVGLSKEDRLLDVAAGQGTSTVLAAREFGCHAIALDLSKVNLERASKSAADQGVKELVETRISDGEQLPFPDDSFDVLLCECAFCLFTDKNKAAGEMARVLRPGGRLALSDMTLTEEDFPKDLNNLLLKVACIADATSVDKMNAAFESVGFVDVVNRDASWGLTDMVKQIRERLLAVELAVKLGKISLGGIDIEEGKRLASRSIEIISEGKVAYTTLTAKKGK